MRLSDFEGEWTITRRIDDRRAARVGALSGTARFVPDSDGLLYVESGVLRFPGEPELEARQRYLWHQDGEAIMVHFQDGRPFHQIDLSGHQHTDQHLCAPDKYIVRYDFRDWPIWSAEWSVMGPRKDHTILTRYSRT